MEIHILLEGEQVGPLSEEQVRQYLSDGLVSGADLASCEGVADWLPLERVLAHLAPVAPEPETESSSPSPAPVEAVSEPVEPPFLIHKDMAPSTEPTAGNPLRQKTASLSSTQRTKRKLNKIVIQPILPLETTLPAKKVAKTGKTRLNLEPLRPTGTLPHVTSHQPREKKAAKSAIQTGQLSFAEFAEKPVAATGLVSPTAPVSELPELVVAPPAAVVAPAEPDPAPAPAPIVSPPPAVPPLSVPIPTLTIPATPPALPTVAPARITSTDTPVVVDVLRPPVERLSTHWKKPEGRRSNTALFPRVPAWALIGGLALLLLIVCGLIAGVYFLFVHEPAPSATPATSADATPFPAQSDTSALAEPTTASDFSDRGLKRQAAGDLDGALADYDKAVSLDPKAVEVYYRRGLAHQAKGDLAGATADYTQVIALNPQRANAFSNRAFIKQSEGDLDGAIADYTQALSINPKIAEAYHNMGLINVKKGDVDGAITDYNHAIAINPQMAFAFYNRAAAKNMEGDTDGAIADYTQSLALNPNIARAYCDRGAARQAKGDNDGAFSDYSRALSLDPRMVDAFYNRSLINLQKGDLDAALADSAQAIALDPKDAPAYNRRGLALFGLGKLDDALTDLKQFCDLAPRDPGADSARLYIWLISSRQNPGADADAELSRALLNDWNSTPEDLTSKIAAFLLGHISESELIANAATPDPSREPGQYCRVFYFAGMKRLIGGDSTTAAAYFQKSVATGQKDFGEYTFAQVELRALNKNAEVAAKPVSGA